MNVIITEATARTALLALQLSPDSPETNNAITALKKAIFWAEFDAADAVLIKAARRPGPQGSWSRG